MNRWFREPLLHFLIAGGVLFGAYAWLNPSSPGLFGPESRQVRIGEGEVRWLAEMWSRQWQREPTPEELRGLVTGLLKEELLSREARELRLDEGDTIVRRRLAQKMEFLVQDTARLAEPDERELRRLYEGARERYQTPSRVSFTQIYFKNDAGAREGLDRLRTRSAGELGDPSILEREYTRADAQEVTSVFGSGFAGEIFALEPGRWHGPIASGYGFHLVRVAERLAAEPRAFDDVRAQLLDEWSRAEEARAHEKFLDGLLKKYDVIVDASVRPHIGPLAGAAR